MSVYGNPEVMGIGVFNSAENMAKNIAHSIPVPSSGADVSPLGFNAESTLINGGGYARNSWTQHKTYNFSWGESASLELASLLNSYRNGSFGRGLIAFSDPMYYRTNLLPRYWADPSMSENFEAPHLTNQAHTIEYFDTPSNTLGLPARSARYTITEFPTIAKLSLVPIVVPPGHSVGIGAVAQIEQGSTFVFAMGGNLSGFSFTGTTAPISITGGNVVSSVYVNETTETRLLFPLMNASPSGSLPLIVSLYGLTVRMAPPGEPIDTTGPWMAGEGHSGCRFVGSPSLISYNGVGGGQVGLSCTFKETGAWE